MAQEFAWGVLLVALCVAALSLCYYNLKTGISCMPSSRSAVKSVIRQAENSKGAICDLGSGWGGIAFAVSHANPNRKVVGIELSTIPWLFSYIKALVLRRKNLEFRRGNFLSADLTEFGTLLCYLCPSLMDELEVKVLSAGCPQTIISNTFEFERLKCVEIVPLTGFCSQRILVYGVEERFSEPAKAFGSASELTG